MDSIRTVPFWFATFCLGFTVLQYAALLLRAALSRQLLRQNRAGRRPVAVVMMIIHLRTFTGISDTVRMLGWSVALTWGYRQLTLVWRIRSLFQAKLAGGEMPRAGFKTESV